MSVPQKTILCIDDYETAAAGWCLFLQSVGYSVTTAYSAQEGLQLFATRPIDLVMLDYAMPDLNGDQVSKAMKSMKPQVPILLFSGVSQLPEETLQRVDAFMQKGVHPNVVLQKIQELLSGPESMRVAG